MDKREQEIREYIEECHAANSDYRYLLKLLDSERKKLAELTISREDNCPHGESRSAFCGPCDMEEDNC